MHSRDMSIKNGSVYVLEYAKRKIPAKTTEETLMDLITKLPRKRRPQTHSTIQIVFQTHHNMV